ncbi:response regulator [Paenibacillus sp. NPDC056933]|uniref:response regulator transcription factor n=1 Tax=Paenibacillus sp. NPDC056933 TaxID=3345968 RepID=UPI003625ED94
MYNIMIVEDSKPILRNIKMLLDKLNFPIHVAVTATNGEEALTALQKHSIDLLLTDIRMPKMDGLSLIEQAKLAQPGLKVILLSGYSDFEYTRKALNLQVFDYLLKPIELEALEEVMSRVIKQLDNQRSRNFHELQEIVDPHDYAELKPEEHSAFLNQMMIVLRRQPFTPERERWGQKTLQASLEDFFAPRPCKVFLSQTPQQYIVFVNRSILDLYSSVHECLESLRRHLYAQGMDTTIGGQPAWSETDDNLSELYHQISFILLTHQRLNNGLVLDTRNSVTMTRTEAGCLDSISESSFVHMIQAHQKEQFALKLSELMNQWREENVHVKEVERFIGLVVDTFAHLIEEQGSGIRLGLDLRAKKLWDGVTYGDFCRELTEWIGQCFEMLQSHGRKSREVLFEQMDEYIQRNKYTQISINDIAMKFHVSPSYVSRVIKNVTNVTFVQYYSKLRIKEACRLMECQPEMKFKELSDLLSFSDQHYFSKVFKEYTGLSPTEYKERLYNR